MPSPSRWPGALSLESPRRRGPRSRPISVAGSLGAALFLQALWLLWRSHADLAESFSPGLQIQKDHRFVTTGVREQIRHQMEVVHLLWAVAQLLLLKNVIAGPAFLVASLPLYVVRIPREEEMMLGEFGEEYWSTWRGWCVSCRGSRDRAFHRTITVPGA